MAKEKNTQFLILVGSVAISGAIIFLTIKGEQKYRDYFQRREIQRLMDTEKTLVKYEKDASGKKIDQVMRNISSMDASILSPSQMRRRFILMGDININYYLDSAKQKDRQYYFDLAVKFYDRAIDYSETREQKNEILRKIAGFYMKNHNWEKAVNLFMEADSSIMSPEERWNLKLNEAECYKHLKKYHDTLALLSQVADECDNDEIWGIALREKADLLLKASQDPAILKIITQNPEATLEKFSQKLQDEAFNNYSEIVKELPALNTQASMSNLGLLEIYVLRKDKSAAYDLANKIQSSSAPLNDKAISLILLAKLEENLENYNAAIDILETCMKRYPKSQLRVKISMTLYDLYKKTEQWEKAFSIAESLFMYKPEEESVIRLVEDFSMDKNKLLYVISSSPQKDSFVSKTKLMITNLRDSYPDLWKKIQNDAYFIFAELLYLSDKYDAAEKELVTCLNTPKNSLQLIEKIYYLDMMCAVNGKRSPVIQIIRAKRYLAKYPDGKFYKEALLTLLDAYYKMDMYPEAITVSKKIYVDEMNTVKRARENSFNQNLWLKTVAIIGLCYEKLGYYDKANKIIKAYSDRLLKTPFAPEVFIEWAKVAQEKGQIQEAIRRIEVVLPYAKDIDEKARLYVAQYLLKLSLGETKDFNKTKRLLGIIEKSGKISPETKKDIERELYEGLLEYTYKNSLTADFNSLLEKTMDKFKDETWPIYWVLRSLSPLFGKTGLETLSEKHKEILKTASGFVTKDKETYDFINDQIKLINSLVNIENTMKKLKTERGLGNERTN
ncbi:MAG: hypothetical protein A2017_09725 [Lentisphaerae bacterium GWF2_44_16]|nr:MAG: hypothetical protein A2017_09725 [Lentisphaerae bacterium GWF2_44_16]